jgi:hypothetical protein
MKPTDYELQLCYKCKCGRIEWVDSKRLKYPYEVDCWCGETFIIPPTTVRVVLGSPKQARSTSQTNPSILQKLKATLKGQGYTSVEVNRMVSGLVIDTKDIGLLVKKALQNYEEVK